MTKNSSSPIRGQFSRAMVGFAFAIQIGCSSLIRRINGIAKLKDQNQQTNRCLSKFDRFNQGCSFANILPRTPQSRDVGIQLSNDGQKLNVISADNFFYDGIEQLKDYHSRISTGRLFDIGKLKFQCLITKSVKCIAYFAVILSLNLFSLGTSQAIVGLWDGNSFDLTWRPYWWEIETSKTITGVSNVSGTDSTFPDVLTQKFTEFNYAAGRRYIVRTIENGTENPRLYTIHGSGYSFSTDDSWGELKNEGEEDEEDTRHDCNGKKYTGFRYDGTYGHWILHLPSYHLYNIKENPRDVHFCPNKEAIASNLAVGESATIKLEVTQQHMEVVFIFGFHFTGIAETEEMELIIKRQAPEVSIKPASESRNLNFLGNQSGLPKVFATSVGQVNLEVDVPPGPTEVQYQLSSSQLFDTNVIDKSIVVGGTDQTVYPLNIIDDRLKKDDGTYPERISIRLIDPDGDDGPNDYAIPKDNTQNIITFEIIEGSAPTLTVESESPYSDDNVNAGSGFFLLRSNFTVIADPPPLTSFGFSAIIGGVPEHGPDLLFNANQETLTDSASALNQDQLTYQLAEDTQVPRRYNLGTPSSATVYRTSTSKPGITLTIEEDSVGNGQNFTVKVKSTHAVTADSGLSVQISTTDTNNRIDGTAPTEIKIDKDDIESFITVRTNKNTTGVENTITVSLVDSANYAVNPAVASDSVTVKAPTLSIINPPTTVAESDGALTFNFMLDTEINLDVMISTSVTSNSTAGTEDYTLPSSPLTIRSETDGSVSIQLTSDSVYEGDETIEVKFTPTNAVFSGNVRTHRLSVTITDEGEKPEISFKDTTLTVAEGNSMDLTLVSTFRSETSYSIGYTLTNATGNFLEIPTGDTESNRSIVSSFALDGTSQMLEQALSIATRTANQLDESDGEITVVLDAPDGTAPYTIDNGAKTVIVTVTDAGGTPLPTITISQPSGPVNEAQGATLTYTFELSNSISEDVSIAYAVSSESTAESGDYMLGTASPIVISGGGSNTTASLVITLANDALYEGDETIILDFTATNAQFSAGVYTKRLTGTIAEDDSKPEISFKSSEKSAHEGGLPVILELGASRNSETPYSIGYTLTNTTGNFLDIPVGATKSNRSAESTNFEELGDEWLQLLSIATRAANQLDEVDGEISVVLDTPDDTAPYTIDDMAKTVTITVTDAGGTAIPTITVTEPSGPVTESQGATLTYTFELSSAISEDVSIAYAISSDSTAEPGDYTLGTTSPLVISGGSSNTTVSLTITIAIDPLYEENETIIIALASTNAVFSAGVYTRTVTGTIMNDDDKPEISFKNASQNAIEGQPFNMTLLASTPAEESYSIGYTLSNNTGDFLEVPNGSTELNRSANSSNFAPAGASQILEQVLSVATRAANGVSDAAGEITVVLDTPDGTAPYTIDEAKKTVTISVADEQALPTISVTEPNGTIAEAVGATLTYSFALSGTPSGNESIAHSVSADSTAEAEDYSLSRISFTDRMATLTITIADDEILEGVETIVLDLTATNAVFSGSGFYHTLTVTITDYGDKPEISFKTATQNVAEGLSFDVTLVASVDSELAYSIEYTMSNAKGDFINIPDGETSAVGRVDSSNFTLDGTSQMLEQTFSIDTRTANGLVDEDGELSVVLNTPADTAPYTIDDARKTVAVTVVDEFRLISITQDRLLGAISLPNDTVAEKNGATLTYRFRLSNAPTGNESITHSVSADSTAEAADYSLGRISFAGRTASLTITIADDAVYEGDETIVIDLTATNARFSDGEFNHTLTVTIRDDGDIPEVSFKTATHIASEGASYDLTLVASFDSEIPYSIGYTMTNTTGDFLKTKAGKTAVSKVVISSFKFNSNSQMLEQKLSIAMRAANGVVDDDGEISVVLDAPYGTVPYTIDDSRKTVSVTVIDEFTHRTIYISNSSSSVTEAEGGTLTYNFVMSSSPSGNESITYSVSADSTAEAEDYSLSRISFNGRTASLTIKTTDDAVYEGDETIVLDLVSTNAVFSTSGYEHTLTITITDDETKPEISFKTATHTTSEGSTFDLTLFTTAAAEASYSIGYTLTNSTGDFLEIPNGAAVLNQNVNSAGFALDETGQMLEQVFSTATRTANGLEDNDGEISVVLDTPDATASYTIDGAMKTVAVTVIDDFSLPTISVTEPSSTVEEANGAALTYNFELSGSTSGSASITHSVSTDSTAEAEEYSLSAITFNGTSASLTVTIADDAVYEGNETIVLDLTSTLAIFSTGGYAKTITITITDNGDKPEVSFKNATQNAAEGHSFDLTLVASVASEVPYSIGYTLTNTTGDFIDIPNDSTEKSLSVNSDFELSSASQMLEQTFSIATRTANGTDDNDGEISVVLDTPDGMDPYTIDNAKKTVTVSVADEFTYPTISISQPSNTIAEANGATLTYTFTLSGTTSGNESITHSVSTSSTAESEDYSLSAIAFSGTTATLTTTIADDSVYEGNETIVLDLTAENAVFSGSGHTHTLTVTITDDESKPEISFKTATQNITEGHSFDLTLTASTTSEATYLIGYTMTNETGDFLAIPVGNTAAIGSVDSSDFELDNTSQMQEQTFSVATRSANGLDDNDGEISVVLDTPDGTASYTIDQMAKTVTVTVIDEITYPTITVTEPTNTDVAESAGTLTYTFTLSQAASGNVSITPAHSNNSTAEVEDYTLSPITFNGTTASLTITVEDDAVYEEDETLILDLTATNAMFGENGFTPALTVTITDNDAKPEISFKSATQTAVEGVSFDLTLVASVASEITFPIGYTLTNTVGDFIDIPTGATELNQSVDSDFTRNGTSQMMEQVMSIDPRSANGQVDDEGEISVVLDIPEGTAPYSIDNAMKTVSVTVLDEFPTIAVGQSVDTVVEADTLTYNFTLSHSFGGNVSITPSTSALSTAETTDYELSPIAFTGTMATLTITSRDDQVYEGDETIAIELTAANALFSNGSNVHTLTVTITDNEVKPNISFKSSTQKTVEGASFELTLVTTHPAESSYSIGYTLTNASGDFLAIPAGSTELQRSIDSDFALNGASQMLEQTLSIPTRTANEKEDDEGEISVVLDTPAESAPYTIDAAKKTVAVTVADSSTSPIISIVEPGSAVVQENGGTLAFSFRLSSIPTGSVSITPSLSNDSTAEAADYRLSPIAFTGRTATLTITSQDDSVYEGDETIVLNLTATNALFSNGRNIRSLTVAITDDEVKPEISFKSAMQSTTEGAPFNLTLVATGLTESSFAIGYTLTNASGDFLAIPTGSTELQRSIDSDFELNGASQLLEQTFSIPTRAATEKEDDEGEITVVLDTPAESAPYTIDAAKKTVSVKVTDQLSLPTISITKPSSSTVEENGGILTYRFNLSNIPSGNVLITPSLATGSTAESDDYALSPIAFNGTTASLTITIEDDAVYEGDEMLVLELTASNAVFGSGESTHILNAMITDNEEKPRISFKTATHTVAEGTTFDLTLVASHDSEGSYSIRYTLTNVTGDFLATPVGASEVMENVGSNFARNGLVLEQIISISTRTANGEKDDNGEISVVLATPDATAPYTIDEAMKTASVSVIDDSVYVISVKSSRLSVTEGEDIDIVIKSNPVPRDDFDAILRVSESQAVVAWPVRRNVKFTKGNGTVNLQLTTMRNSNTTGSGTVKVEVVGGAGYMVGNPVSVQVVKPESPATVKYSVVSSVITSILSNIPPTPPQGSSVAAKPKLSISASKGSVAEGETTVFAISASFAVDSDISVKIKLSQYGDFVSGPMDRSVNLTENNLEALLEVETDDDELAELDGMITATILIGNGYLVGSENTANVAISDALDVAHRKNRVSNAIEAALPDLLAHSAIGTFAIASERAKQAFSGSSTTSVELNGKSSAVAMLRSGGSLLNDSDTDWRSIIDGSSFAVALNPDGGETSSVTVWGVGDRLGLSGDVTGGQQSWDAETYTGHFGFDALFGRGLLTGLAMSVSNAEINYGRGENTRLSLDARATGVHPYFGLESPNGNSSMQFLAGYGVSEMDLKQEEFSPEILNGQFHSVGLSGNNRLYSNDNFRGLRNLELSLAGEAWHAQQSVNSVTGVVGSMQARASRFRIAIEGSNDHYLNGIGIISPSISIGLQGDFRNQESLTGLNVSSDNKFAAFNGLAIEGSGRFMLSKLNWVRGWEIGSSLDYDYGSDGKGILLYMEPSWSGTDTSIDENIFGSEFANASNDSLVSSEGGSFSAEIGFGLEVLDGAAIATPFFDVEQSTAYGSEYRVGSRFATGTGVRVEFGLARDIPATGVIDHDYNLKGSINW